MRISPIAQNRTTFMAGNGVVRSSGVTSSDDALLMLQDPKSAVLFKKSQEEASKANSSNPITSLGYTLYRTFKYIVDVNTPAPSETEAEQEKFVAIA